MQNDVNKNNETPTVRSIISAKKTNKKAKRAEGVSGYIINVLLYSLIGISFVGINFILFASSGSINIFNGEMSLKPEIMYILAGITIFVFLLYFIFSFLSILMNLLTAFIVFLTSIATFNQFANFSTESISSGKSEFVISVILAVAVFCMMLFFKKRYKALVTLTAVFCFSVVLVNQNKTRPEFAREETVVAVVTQEDSKNFINIMMPNAPSYSYISSLKENEANSVYKNQLKSIMLGFYAKNRFRIYPNAYTTDGNSYLSAAKSLNYVTEDSKSYLQTQVLKNSYWQFKDIENFEVYVKENKMYDDLKAKGFQINAYQSRGINLCKKNDKNNVSRCVTKINTPVNIDSLKLTTSDKIFILFSQWLESTGWFAYGMETVYSYMKPIFNPNQTPIIGMSYKNLYVINSLDLLDIVADDIARDKGLNAYFVMLDLPSDMYVYDELCQLKKSDLWLKKLNQPWVDSKNNIEKRNMYLRQTMCVFGKLEQFLHKLKDSDNLDNSTIIIQGLSGMDDAFTTSENSLADVFRNENMVTMAVRTPDSKKFMVTNSICAVEDILNMHLNNGSKCEEFNHTVISKTTKAGLKDASKKVKFTSDIAQKAVRDYVSWYKNWYKLNYKGVSGVAAADTLPVKTEESAPSGLLPMEETNVGKMKIMSKQVNVASEEKVIPLSEVALVPVGKSDAPIDLMEQINRE